MDLFNRDDYFTNKFLSCRRLNIYQAANQFGISGFIREDKITNILKGKGRGVGKFTFKALPLELDKRLHAAPIFHIGIPERFEEEVYGDFFSEKPASLAEQEDSQEG